MKMMKNMSWSFVAIVAAFLCITTFAGCSDKEAQAEIDKLTQENAQLQKNVESLQHNLDSLKAYSDSVKTSLKKLDMGH